MGTVDAAALCGSSRLMSIASVGSSCSCSDEPWPTAASWNCCSSCSAAPVFGLRFGLPLAGGLGGGSGGGTIGITVTICVTTGMKGVFGGGGSGGGSGSVSLQCTVTLGELTTGAWRRMSVNQNVMFLPSWAGEQVTSAVNLIRYDFLRSMWNNAGKLSGPSTGLTAEWRTDVSPYDTTCVSPGSLMPSTIPTTALPSRVLLGVFPLTSQT